MTQREIRTDDGEISSLEALRLSFRYLGTFYKKFSDAFEKYLPIMVVFSFIGGVLLAKNNPLLAEGIGASVDGFMDLYGFIAPAIIFIILAPSLARISSDRGGKHGKFISYAFARLSMTRFLSLIWAVLFTWVVFDIPFIGGDTNIYSSLKQTFSSLVWMATHSAYFFAMYLSVAAVFVARRYRVFKAILDRTLTFIENAGQYLVPIIPVFMLAIGAYVYQLPNQMNNNLGEAQGMAMQPLTFLGISFETNTASGMVIVYGLISLIIGIACFIFHMMLVFWAKIKVSKFSIKQYFKRYWIGVYPLLWATSSEALATPLNLYLVKRHFPWVRPQVRHFAVGVGSYLGINGTMICVIVLVGAVVNILGIDLSVTQLIMSIPLVFLIGFGVPGIPGELLLFGGPLVQLFGFPPEVAPIFLAVYLGLQIGLPDSFRTGSNSTDNAVMAVLFNDTFEKKYRDDGLVIDMLLEDLNFKRLFASNIKDRLLSAPVDANLLLPELSSVESHRIRRRMMKDQRKIQLLSRHANDLAELHAVISSCRGGFYRFRLLQLVVPKKSLEELERLRIEDDVEELFRHLRMLQKFDLIDESESDGRRIYERTEKGERSVNALRALGRRLGETDLLKILNASFGINSIRLFLSAYGYKKDIDFKQPGIEFSSFEMGQITLPIYRSIEGASAIDKLSSAEILVFLDNGNIRMNSKKATAFYQYLVDLHKILRGGTISHGFLMDYFLPDLTKTQYVRKSIN